jgi:hypothetical protein
MDGELIIAALLTFGLFLASIAVLFRMTLQEAAIVWIIRAFIGIGIVVGGALARRWGLIEYIWWASLYSLFTALFIFGVFSFMEASLTIRIFTEIARFAHGITMADFMKKYNRSRIVERRIARLLYSGELKKSHGMYMLGRTSYFRVRELLLNILRLAFDRS